MRWIGRLMFGALLCALAAVGACGDDPAPPETGTSTGTATGSSGSGGGPNPIECKGAPPELALQGTWAAYVRLSVKLLGSPGGAIAICPEDQVGEANLLLLMTIKQDAADKTNLPEITSTLCSIELPNVTALVGMCDPMSPSLVTAQIVVPQELLTALPNLIAMPVTGKLEGTGDGSAIDMDRLTVTVGSSKAGNALPEWNTDDATCGVPELGHSNCETKCVDDCAAMRDDDADMFPGVTVHVCGVTPDDLKKDVKCNAYQPNEPGSTLQGQAFLDMEVDPKFSGTAKSSCELIGTIDMSVLYNIVGADVYLTGGSIGVTSAIKSLPTFSVDPLESKFRMVRIDGQYDAPDFNVDPKKAAEACQVIINRMNEL